MNNYVAKAEVLINAPISKVWDALINPDIIKQYMFNTNASSDWKVGDKITWKGEYNGKEYEDHGVILEMKTESKLKYTHHSPLSGEADDPKTNPTVTFDLTKTDHHTILHVTQDNNRTEEACRHSEKNWNLILQGMKKILERS